MSGLIDYAGLFPPADLNLKSSINNYSNYIRGSRNWMMSKFILPSSKISGLNDNLMKHFNSDFPLNLSLISSDFYLDKVELTSLMDNFPGIVFCTGVESRIHEINQFESLYEKNRIVCSEFDRPIQTFYEIERNSNWENEVKQIVKQLSDLNKNYRLNHGFKLRCGGVEKNHFPSSQECAIAINLCRDYNVAMKFTAGLHHPMRHFSESVGTRMYGFFNIFIGGMMSYKFQLNIESLLEILEDENANHFQFSDNGVSWKNFDLSQQELQKLRSEAFISYGSCSFEEPCEDLKNLGLL